MKSRTNYLQQADATKDMGKAEKKEKVESKSYQRAAAKLQQATEKSEESRASLVEVGKIK